MTDRTARGRRARTLAILLPSLAAPLSPMALAAQRGEPTRTAVATEILLPAQPELRDVRVYGVALELERPLAEALWLRFAVGPLVTRGTVPDPFGCDLGCAARNAEADGVGVSVLAFLRIRPARAGPFAPFAEAGGGGVFTTEAFPPGGTWWNLSYRYGGGLDVALGGGVTLALAYRYAHVSNGKATRFRNPAYNGRGLALALAW